MFLLSNNSKTVVDPPPHSPKTSSPKPEGITQVEEELDMSDPSQALIAEIRRGKGKGVAVDDNSEAAVRGSVTLEISYLY